MNFKRDEKIVWRTLLSLALVCLTALAASCSALTGGEQEPLSASGTVEVVELMIAPELGGRVLTVYVEEGQAVGLGEPLIQLEDQSLRIRREQIKAGGQATIAAARLELLAAQQSLEALYDEAPLLQAQMQLALATARDGFDDAEYDWRVQQEGNRASGETIAAARANLILADDEVGSAEKAYNRVSSRPSDDSGKAVARSSLAAARQHRDAVERRLNWYLGHPDEIDQAILDAELALAQANLLDAEREWDELENGIDPDLLALAQARLANAEAQLAAAEADLAASLDAIDLELSKFTVQAPVDSVVITRSVEPGEILQPGFGALQLGQMDAMTITVYIPEDRYGSIGLQDVATITADSFPGESFHAVVTNIADQAEYTPRNVTTAEERSTTVFAVELTVSDSNGQLKPGMPVDVVFEG